MTTIPFTWDRLGVGASNPRGATRGSFSTLHKPTPHSSIQHMSFLRRRFGGNDSSSTEPSREPTPDPDRPSNLRVVTAEKLHTLKKGRKQGNKKNFWIFGLGGVFGVLAAAFFAGSNDMIDLSSLESVNLDSILEALPAGFLKDAQQLQVRMASLETGLCANTYIKICRETSTNPLHLVETRTRCRQLRLLCCGSPRTLTGRLGCPSSHHGSRCYIDRSRVLGH